MTSLNVTDGILGGVVAWYSIIHTPPRAVAGLFGEFARVLAPGGQLLLAFQAADNGQTTPQAFEHKVARAYRWPLDAVSVFLRRAGLLETAPLLREPEEGERYEQAYLLAQKTTGS